MAKKDDIIRGLQRKVDQQTQRIKELESQLYKASLMSEGTGPGVQAILDKADRDRQEMEAKLEAWGEMFRYHYPPFNTAFPLWLKLVEVGAIEVDNWPVQSFVTETPPDETRELFEANNPNIAFYQMSDEAISVGVTISFFDGEHTGQLYNQAAFFPGTKEQAYEALAPYFYSLLKLSATPEDLAARGMMNYYKRELGKQFEHSLLNAMLQIAEFYYVDHVAERFLNNVINNAFNEHIAPALPENLTPNEIGDARRDFSETVKATFKNVVNRRWPQAKHRRLKPGPKQN